MAGAANVWLGFQVYNSKLWGTMSGDLTDGTDYQNLTFILALSIGSFTIAVGILGVITAKFS